MLHHGIDRHEDTPVIGTVGSTDRVLEPKRISTRRIGLLQNLRSCRLRRS